MVTFPSTSVEPRGCRRAAATSALLLVLGAFGGGSLLHAGTVITLTNGSEIDGKLSVAGPAVHAEAESSPPDTAVSDVLESTFDDAPFALTVFRVGKIDQLPAGWTAQSIGNVTAPGSVSVQDGAFTVNGTNLDPKQHDKADRLYYVGMPWPDNGQFTARLASLVIQGDAWAGLMCRDSLDPVAASCSALLTGQGQIRMPFRRDAHGDDWGPSTTGDAPIWLRLTREGNTLLTSMSSDGTTWDIIGVSPFKTLATPLFGLTASVRDAKGQATAVFDNVSLTPLPSSAQVLPPGVLLQGGSLLAGRVSHLSLDPSTPDNNGELLRGEKKMPLSRSTVAAVITLPIERSQLDALSSQPGLLMRNGDTTDGTITEVDFDHITVSSVLLGISTYKPTETRACFLAPLQSKPAAYEVRLFDGSILNASAITGDANEVVITDVSGLTIQVDQDEVAQIRAGNAVVQNLAQVDWKATGPAAPAATAPTPAPPAAIPPATANPADAGAANNGAPAANPASPPAPPLVASWLGKDQQQILETGMDTAIDFPLAGKFRSLGVQVALSSDSPPNATATIRFLANGQELAKSPPFHAGDPPRFLELSLPGTKHITLQAQSMFPGTKVLYLDPVAIRQ